MTLRTEITELLINGVPDMLRLSNITGIQGDPEHCPIANYLRIRSYAFATVSVGERFVTVFDEEDGILEQEDTPHAFRVFMAEFDNGKYPELTEKNV